MVSIKKNVRLIVVVHEGNKGKLYHCTSTMMKACFSLQQHTNTINPFYSKKKNQKHPQTEAGQKKKFTAAESMTLTLTTDSKSGSSK